MDAMDARASSTLAAPERAAAEQRLREYGKLAEGCLEADIRGVVVPREEWIHDWHPNSVVGETFPRPYGWLVLVKDRHFVPDYSAAAVLEHEILHALLSCAGEDSHGHVGPWWDGIR